MGWRGSNDVQLVEWFPQRIPSAHAQPGVRAGLHQRLFSFTVDLTDARTCECPPISSVLSALGRPLSAAITASEATGTTLSTAEIAEPHTCFDRFLLQGYSVNRRKTPLMAFPCQLQCLEKSNESAVSVAVPADPLGARVPSLMRPLRSALSAALVRSAPPAIG